MRRAHVALFASLALGVSTLAGCGSDSLEDGGSDDDNATSEVEVDDDVADLVPEDRKLSLIHI